MKSIVFFLSLITVCIAGRAQSPTLAYAIYHLNDLPTDRYISVSDSLPEYSNITSVLLRGKEFNRFTGHCPVLAMYITSVGWVAADRKPWKTPLISHKKFKKLDVSYWYPLPACVQDRQGAEIGRR